jgi:pilus assembly protein CpaC
LQHNTSRRAIAFGLAALTGIGPVAAQNAPIMSFDSAPRQRHQIEARVPSYVDLGVGRTEVIDLPQDAADIFVSNPAVAVAVIKSARRLFLVGQSMGSTTIFVMDSAGRRFANMEVRVNQDLSLLQQILAQSLPGADIKSRMVGNMVMLTGEVDSLTDATRASDIANAFINGPTSQPALSGATSVNGMGGAPSAVPALGGQAGATGPQSRIINSIQVRAKDQVMLRVTVAEVNRSTLKQLGVNTSGTWNIGKLAFNYANPVTAINGALPGNQVGFGYTGNNKAAGTLSALEQAGVAKTLAEPTLAALSGETANFLVGGEVPIPSPSPSYGGTASSGGASVAPQVTYKKFGVSLSFTPVVFSQGKISLRVSTEVSDIDPSLGTSIPDGNGSSLNIPGFKTRKSDTTVELPSGGSMMTAGLISQATKQTMAGLPGLVNLPILGALARSRDYSRSETELVIIVTPYLAQGAQAKALTRPDKNLREASEPAQVALGQLTAVNASRKARPSLRALDAAGFVVD